MNRFVAFNNHGRVHRGSIILSSNKDGCKHRRLQSHPSIDPSIYRYLPSNHLSFYTLHTWEYWGGVLFQVQTSPKWIRSCNRSLSCTKIRPKSMKTSKFKPPKFFLATPLLP